MSRSFNVPWPSLVSVDFLKMIYNEEILLYHGVIWRKMKYSMIITLYYDQRLQYQLQYLQIKHVIIPLEIQSGKSMFLEWLSHQ